VTPLLVPKTKLNQIGLWACGDLPLNPEQDVIQVGAHICGDTKVEAHKREITVKAKGNNQDTKATKSKKKTGKAKHSAFHNGKNDCKESVKLAKTLHIQELMNLMKNREK
jgi:hypothetical protein